MKMYKPIILRLVLFLCYVCLSKRKEHILCVQDQGCADSILTLEKGHKRRQEKMV